MKQTRGRRTAPPETTGKWMGARRGRKPNPVLADERRAQILSAARQVFTRKGYQSATMSDVAVAAGLGKGTLYGYWRSKEDLLYDLMLEVHARIEAGLREALDTPGTISVKMQRAFQFRALLFLENPELMRLFRAVTLSNEEALRNRFGAERRHLVDRLSTLMQVTLEKAQARGELPADLDARMAAQVSFVFMEGLAITALTASENFDALSVFLYAMEQFFHPLLSGK